MLSAVNHCAIDCWSQMAFVYSIGNQLPEELFCFWVEFIINESKRCLKTDIINIKNIRIQYIQYIQKKYK